jgi:hypothetical protein
VNKNYEQIILPWLEQHTVLFGTDDCEIQYNISNLEILQTRTYLWIFNKLQSTMELKLDDDINAGNIVKKYFMINENTLHPKTLPILDADDIRNIINSSDINACFQLGYNAFSSMRLNLKHLRNYVKNIFNRYIKYSSDLWTIDNIHIKMCACIYITCLFFNISLYSIKLILNSVNMWKYENLIIQDCKLLLRDLNWKLI